MLGYLIAVYSSFASDNIMDRLDGSDIFASTERLKIFSLNQSIEYPLGKDGSCSFDKDKAYITFKGNKGNFGEILQIANTDKEKLIGYSIKGKVQKNVYDIFKSHEHLMLEYIKLYSARNHISFNDIKITVEGYSRGTTFAKLAAISITDNLGVRPINVLNYAPISIFDQQAADQYDLIIGKYNHINFIADEDFVPPIFTGQKPLVLKIFNYTLKGDFKPVGIDIPFSAYNSTVYCKEVQRNHYLHLSDGLYACMPFSLSVKEWNAHMPEIYNFMSLVSYKRQKKFYLEGKYKL